MQLARGELWDGRYRVEHVLGRGSFGVVYAVRDETDGRSLALKLMRGAARKRNESLRLEFALLARFRHPNLVGVERFGEVDGSAYLIEELVAGPTLDRWIADHDVADVPHVAIGVLRGLAYLHGNGFVHQDIKPTNILIADDSDGGPKITDLGIAALRGTEEGDHVSGTLQFLSPERLRGAPADPRADLWALGMTLHASIGGRIPVRANTVEALAEELDVAPIAPLRDACPAASPELERFVGRLLAIDPRERFRDAGEALADLERAHGVVETAVAIRPALVGRDAALGRARRALIGRATPGARVVVVRAPTGFGRTRLLDEIAVHAQLAGATTVHVASRPGVWPWDGALAELGARAARGGADRLAIPESAAGDGDPRQTGRFEAVVGELGLRRSSDGDVAEQIADRLAVRAGLLVVDDLDDRDGAARAVVERVAQSLAARPIRHVAGIVASAGPGWTAGDPAAIQIVDLPGLDAAAIEQLVASALGGTAPASVTTLLAREAGGSPAFAVDSLRALIADGALKRVGSVWNLSDDAIDVVRRGAAADRRLAEVSPAARAALDALALFGPGAEVALAILGAATALDDFTIAAAIEELCAAQLARVVPGTRGSGVAHRSEAVRAACAARVEPAARAAIHLRAWNALRAAGVGDPLILCPHALGAGLEAEARALANDAVDAALARGDHLLALAAADLAVAATGHGRAAVVQRARVLLELGRITDAIAALDALDADVDDRATALMLTRAAIAAGDVGRAQAAIARAETIAMATAEDRAELAVLQVDVARLRDPDAALRAGDRVLAELAGDDARRGRVHLSIAQAAIARGDHDRCGVDLGAALAIAEQREDHAQIAEIQFWLAATSDMQNRTAIALGHIERGLVAAARTPSAVPYARLLGLRGIMYIWAGRLDDAAESFLESERRARVAGSMRHAGSAAGNLLVVHRRQGLFDLGLAAAIRSLRIKRVLRDRVGTLTTYVNLADLYHDMGDLDMAEAATRHALSGGRGLNQHRLVAQATLALAAIQVERGELELAKQSIARAETALDEHNRGEALTIRGRLARASGDGEAALVLFGRAIDQTRATGNSHDEAHALIQRAELLGDLGAGDLARAADACTRSGSRLMAWSARARLGRLLHHTGQLDAGDRELARAREMYHQVVADLSPRHLARFHAAPGRAELVALTLAAAAPAPIDPTHAEPQRDTDSMDTMIAVTRPRTRTDQ